jgi:RNA recognition motif-containing protein
MFIGNLSFRTSEDDLRSLFEDHGSVQSTTLPMDRDTGQPRGFAFVEMESGGDAQKAMIALNGKEIHGRVLNVSEARRREDDASRRPPTLKTRIVLDRRFGPLRVRQPQW